MLPSVKYILNIFYSVSLEELVSFLGQKEIHCTGSHQPKGIMPHFKARNLKCVAIHNANPGLKQ